ncbi:hypothetical protein JXR93_02445, partial [bacterium]|nr:hypothetical protein [bacterium]
VYFGYNPFEIYKNELNEPFFAVRDLKSDYCAIYNKNYNDIGSFVIIKEKNLSILNYKSSIDLVEIDKDSYSEALKKSSIIKQNISVDDSISLMKTKSFGYNWPKFHKIVVDYYSNYYEFFEKDKVSFKSTENKQFYVFKGYYIGDCGENFLYINIIDSKTGDKLKIEHYYNLSDSKKFDKCNNIMDGDNLDCDKLDCEELKEYINSEFKKK